MFTLYPGDESFLDTLDFFLKLFGGIGGLYLFFEGIKRYKIDQVWKRSEFVAKEIKEFTSDQMVRNTMYMIDWGTRKIELFPDKPDYADRYVKVDRKLLKQSLVHHIHRIPNPGESCFTPEEQAIRDHFDHFLSYFERFDQFIDAKVITAEEIEPYLRYWVRAITEGIEEEVREALYIYIEKYEFDGTKKLFEKFNKNIKPTSIVDRTETPKVNQVNSK